MVESITRKRSGHCDICFTLSEDLVVCETCGSWVCEECRDSVEDICRNCEGWEYADFEHERERLDAYIIDDLYETYKRDMRDEKKEMERKVMDIVLKMIKPGEVFRTPSGSATFIVEKVVEDGVVFKVGVRRQLEITVSADCLNDVPMFLERKGWVLVGARHDRSSPKGSFDEYLKRFAEPRGISAASYVVPILERILLVQVDTRDHHRIRLIR